MIFTVLYIYLVYMCVFVCVRVLGTTEMLAAEVVGSARGREQKFPGKGKTDSRRESLGKKVSAFHARVLSVWNLNKHIGSQIARL